MDNAINMAERITAVEEKVKSMKEYNTKEHKELRDAVLRIEATLANIFDKLDKRYASKEVEIAMKRLNWMIILAVLGGILSLVIIK